MLPVSTLSTSVKRSPPSTAYAPGLSSSFAQFVNAPGITIRSFPTLFILFATLLIYVHGAVIGVDQQIRAVGGIPGPPAHKTPPRKGLETPTTSDLTTSTFASTSALASTTNFAQHPSMTKATTQASTSGITIFPTLGSTSNAAFTLSSSLRPMESTLTSMSASSSSVPSVLPSTLTIIPTGNPSCNSSSSRTIVTSLPSEWPQTTSTIATSTPTAITTTSTKQSLERRNLTIILTTVLITVTFSFVASMLLLTRCCTRRPLFSTPWQRTKTQILDKEIQPWWLENITATKQELPRAITPSIFTVKFPISESSSPHEHASLSTPTPILLSPTITTTTLASPIATFGLTLPPPPPQIKSPSPRLSPFPPRRHPNILAGSPRHSKYLFHQSHDSHISSAQSTQNTSLPATPRSIECRLLAEMPPARFTFGDGAVGQWTRWGEHGRASVEKETRESVIWATAQRIQTSGVGEAL